MAPPPPWPRLFVLVALLGLLGPSEVGAGPAEEAGARCPGGSWPLPPQVSPRVTYTRMIPGAAEDVNFLYHPCVHPWLKTQLALLAHACVAQPSLAPDSSLTQDRPLVLTAWGQTLEMAWVEPVWAAHWLKRRRRRRKRPQERAGLPEAGHARSSPSMQSPGRGRPGWGGCVQAPALAFALRSWRPPGTEVAARALGQLSPGGARRRGLRAALGLQPTSTAPRPSSASAQNWEARRPTLGTLDEGVSASAVSIVPMLPGGHEGNASSRTESQRPKGQGSPGRCACPSKASPAPRAATPPRVARGPTPRTEEAAWAATTLTFLLVVLTLATLCTRLHRNFRRGESIYWGPTEDSQDTVAGCCCPHAALSAPAGDPSSRPRQTAAPTGTARSDSGSRLLLRRPGRDLGHVYGGWGAPWRRPRLSALPGPGMGVARGQAGAQWLQPPRPEFLAFLIKLFS
ncbi:tumor protein p53-inducible protein 13 isoform X2 [Echinops telfairi]|uniref:Tumor protein p53-inducible protein 13 isoform X2 n=1 Tax=Echinops telfairi TaxID=9371 RepID=A0AC55DV48_ECHTE|nr:tumor protein p53-inducible protein 13 isoform X2 [Echinops telfairi]